MIETAILALAVIIVWGGIHALLLRLWFFLDNKAENGSAVARALWFLMMPPLFLNIFVVLPGILVGTLRWVDNQAGQHAMDLAGLMSLLGSSVADLFCIAQSLIVDKLTGIGIGKAAAHVWSILLQVSTVIGGVSGVHYIMHLRKRPGAPQ